MSKAEYFDWSTYGNDIHIGTNKRPQDYSYRNNKSRSEYYKEWYEKNRSKHIGNVQRNQNQGRLTQQC